MNQVGRTFSLIFKKNIALLLCIVAFSSAIDSKNTPDNLKVKRQKIVNYVLVNDTIEMIPTFNEETKLYHLVVDRSIKPKAITILLDSSFIKKYNLNQYHIYITDDKKNQSVWIDYPVKELYNIRKSNTEIIIQAMDNLGHTFTDKLIVDFKNESASVAFVWLIFVFVFFGLVLVIYFWFDFRIAREKFLLETEINKRTKELSEQKAKYEELLTNYLPKEDFEKLKEKSKDKTERFKMVTVLFSNILGFTKVADQENAERLIDDIDKFFFEFDDVVKKLHIEKIKSIGDSYMCAGGIPQKNRTNPIEVVLAAFEMQQYMMMIKDQYVAKNQKIWDLRMGIHTGPVFSNSTTSKKRFEIWGDTVNIASRMEASGEIGKVNITGMTYELVKDYFLCQYRGKMPVKYKGEIDMYFIEGFRPVLSIDGLGIKANRTFDIRLALIRFDDLEEHIMNILEEKLPRNLYYHNLKHTIDVTVQVELIGRGEGIDDEDLLLLKTAALFHDTGFIVTYKDHEEAGVELAKQILPGYDYTKEQIEKISEIIMVTKLPPQPENLLERIICDADLDYLGRVDFIPVSGNLFRELTEHKIIEDDINRWNQIQIAFIEKHQYFTETAKRLRDVNKNNQLEAIRRLVEENN
ncbi:MAG: HD domain-containing protein [Salinivirgaceae bacterium]|nr:HD domain-containing protein [Salinivirgaceae bacterium]